MKKKITIRFPAQVLRPVWHYLKREEKKLVKRKKELKKEDPFSQPERANDNAAPDQEAAEQFGHARVSALVNEINKNLIRVRKSLTRIKIGKYGLCRVCKKMINTERLAADPTAERCLECEKKLSAKS